MLTVKSKFSLDYKDSQYSYNTKYAFVLKTRSAPFLFTELTFFINLKLKEL